MATVPSPQLVEEFNALPLLAEVVTGSVALSTVNPKFGYGCGVVLSDGGFTIQYTETQFPIVNVSRFMLGLWVRLDAQPPDTIAAVDYLTVSGLAAVRLRILTTEATAGQNDRFQWITGTTTGAAFALPVGVWRYMEVRGNFDTPALTWTVATRLHGVDQQTATGPSVNPDRFVSAVTLAYPASPAEPGLVMGLDRWWWWAGIDTDPMPEWWSTVAGWNGEYPLASISASLLPGYSSALISRNDRGDY